MKVMTLIFVLAIIMALSITLTMRNSDDDQQQQQNNLETEETALYKKKLMMPSKRLSRFLAENKPRNPRAADHCKRNNEICHILEGKNSTCCNNKCIDLGYDSHNCGACKNKCLVTESCCNGECVNLSYDKRHCGFCQKKCMPGGYCIYGICDYA